ncbi:hypothetical protein DSECCO2_85970 [anaerobic digester metagenome]
MVGDSLFPFWRIAIDTRFVSLASTSSEDILSSPISPRSNPVLLPNNQTPTSRSSPGYRPAYIHDAMMRIAVILIIYEKPSSPDQFAASPITTGTRRMRIRERMVLIDVCAFPKIIHQIRERIAPARETHAAAERITVASSLILGSCIPPPQDPALKDQWDISHG